jgi:hypothetical protein
MDLKNVLGSPIVVISFMDGSRLMVMFDNHHFGTQMPEGAIHPISLNVCFAPQADSCTAAKKIPFRVECW